MARHTEPRLTKAGTLAIEAECQVCGWCSGARNALGNAAQHHDKTGHEVYVELTTFVRYGSREATLAASGQEAMEV